MLNWVAILRRILKLYNVHSSRELGMALGIPLRIGEDGRGDEPLPWPMLEMVVKDRGVSWDWLLTGQHFRPPGATKSGTRRTRAGEPKDEEPIVKRKPSPAKPQIHTSKPPRFETRELARSLLPGAGARQAEPDESPSPAVVYAPESSESVNARREDEVIRELREVKESMQRELARVEEILRKREE